MMRGVPEVSVVMPAYNAATTILRSMRSVLSQQDVAVELIVVDDRSTDRTWDLVQETAASDPRVVPIRQQANGGVSDARNTGIDAAQGGKLAFLDSDDCWHPGKLAAQLRFMRESGGAICYAPYRRVDAAGRQLSVVVPPRRVDYRAMLRSNRIGNLTAVYDRRLGDARFKRIGHEDYVFWLEMVRKAGVALRLPAATPVADYLVRAGSLSADKWRAASWQWSIYREIAGLDPIRSGWYFLNYAAIALGKRR